jgi:hypothetical protein
MNESYTVLDGTDLGVDVWCRVRDYLWAKAELPFIFPGEPATHRGPRRRPSDIPPTHPLEIRCDAPTPRLVLLM